MCAAEGTALLIFIERKGKGREGKEKGWNEGKGREGDRDSVRLE